ncbi:MAG: hypothetical protein II557_11695, partial [Clostridia bacterium]|nr:hypothetical protein [Clostridia bacterium]
MMYKRILAAALALSALFSLPSCGFIVVNDVSSRRAGRAETASDETEDGEVPEVTGFVKYRTREDAKALSASYVEALPARDYEGAVFFVTTPDASFLSPEDTGTVLSRLALQRNEEIAERFNVNLLTSEVEPATMLEEMRQAAEAGTFYTDLLLLPFYRVGEYKAADLLRSCGYDGVEWTARRGGFVEPATATAADLKRARDAAAAAGIKAESLIVDFLRGDEPGAERLVMNAAEAGFKSFRGAYFRYDRAKTHRENMDAFRSGFDSLAALAEKSGMKCCYQNHSTYNKSVPLF